MLEQWQRPRISILVRDAFSPITWVSPTFILSLILYPFTILSCPPPGSLWHFKYSFTARITALSIGGKHFKSSSDVSARVAALAARSEDCSRVYGDTFLLSGLAGDSDVSTPSGATLEFRVKDVSFISPPPCRHWQYVLFHLPQCALPWILPLASRLSHLSCARHLQYLAL